MEAFVTLATNDSYAIGALVWAHALRRVHTSKHICVMVTDAVSQDMRSLLAEVANSVQPVQHILVPPSASAAASAGLSLLGRPDLQGLALGLAKLRVWQLTQFVKVVYMDADTLPLTNIDELLEREELSAAPDPGWPDWFNSGVMVLRPSEATFQMLMRRAAESPASLVDGSDQGLLNTCLSDRWKSADISRRLPFGYNCLSYAFYSYLPALRHFRDTVKVVHFAGGGQKPWQLSRRPLLPTSSTMEQTKEYRAEFLGEWWNVYDDCVLPRLAASGHSPHHRVEEQSGQTDNVSQQNYPHQASHSSAPATWQQLPTPMPYEPPLDVPAFYPATNGPPASTIDYCAEPRQFTPLDTHYAEPPMGGVAESGDLGMPAMYSGQEFFNSCSTTADQNDDSNKENSNQKFNRFIEEKPVISVVDEVKREDAPQHDQNRYYPVPDAHTSQPPTEPTFYSSQMAKYEPAPTNSSSSIELADDGRNSEAAMRRRALIRAICSHPVDPVSATASKKKLRRYTFTSRVQRSMQRRSFPRQLAAEAFGAEAAVADEDEDRAATASSGSTSSAVDSMSPRCAPRLAQCLLLAGQTLPRSVGQMKPIGFKTSDRGQAVSQPLLPPPPPPPVPTPADEVDQISSTNAKSASIAQQLLSRRLLKQRLASVAEASKPFTPVVGKSKKKGAKGSGKGGVTKKQQQASTAASAVSGASFTDRNQRLAWERGEVDYRGRDAFDSVLDRLRQFVDDLD